MILYHLVRRHFDKTEFSDNLSKTVSPKCLSAEKDFRHLYLGSPLCLNAVNDNLSLLFIFVFYLDQCDSYLFYAFSIWGCVIFMTYYSDITGLLKYVWTRVMWRFLIKSEECLVWFNFILNLLFRFHLPIQSPALNRSILNFAVPIWEKYESDSTRCITDALKSSRDLIQTRRSRWKKHLANLSLELKLEKI